jgi:hypothetical protein
MALVSHHQLKEMGHDPGLSADASCGDSRMNAPANVASNPSAEFLKAHDVGLSFAEPGEQVRQATVDVIDIETGDLHRTGERSQWLLEKSLLFSVETCPPSGKLPDLTRRVVAV